MKIDFDAREDERIRRFKEIWEWELQGAFAHLAPYYDKANSIASLGLWDKWRQLFVKTITAPPSGSLLDVCAGTNSLGLEILEKYPNLNITAIDYSEEMQAIGKDRAKKRGVKIESVIGNVHSMPFKDDTFDVVTIEAASRHLKIKKGFSEILRVLKPGGKFYHCDLLRPKSKIVEKIYYSYLNFAIGITGILFSSSNRVWNCKDYFIKAIQLFYSPDEFSELLRGIGFVDIKYKDIFTGLVSFHQARKPN